MLAQLQMEAIQSECERDMKLWHNVMNEIEPQLGETVIGKMPARYWCAEILGPSDKFRFERSFLKPKWDYRYANSKATRGAYVYYLLESGHLYEAKCPRSWRRSDRFFCVVNEDGEIQKINEEEAIDWLKAKNLWG